MFFYYTFIVLSTMIHLYVIYDLAQLTENCKQYCLIQEMLLKKTKHFNR